MKINVTDSDKIAAALAKTQKRAQVRTLHRTDVLQAAERAELKLEALKIPKKDRPGTSAYYGYEKFPSSYKWSPEGTLIALERFPTGWFLVDVVRARCDIGRNRLDLTVHQRDIVIANALTDAAKF